MKLKKQWIAVAILGLGFQYGQLAQASLACKIYNHTDSTLTLQESSGGEEKHLASSGNEWVYINELQISAPVAGGGLAKVALRDTHQACMPSLWGWYLAIGDENRRVCVTKEGSADVYATHAVLHVMGNSTSGYHAVLRNQGLEGLVGYPMQHRAADVAFTVISAPSSSGGSASSGGVSGGSLGHSYRPGGLFSAGSHPLDRLK